MIAAAVAQQQQQQHQREQLRRGPLPPHKIDSRDSCIDCDCTFECEQARVVVLSAVSFCSTASWMIRWGLLSDEQRLSERPSEVLE